MKILQILVLTLVLLVLTVGAVAQKAVLSGTVYDANGAVIPETKITATNEKGEKFETVSNSEGIYILNLAFNQYDTRKSADFEIAEYEITVEREKGFEKFVLKKFKFIPSYKGKMNLDIALDVAENTNCGAGGCIEDGRLPVESSKIEVSDKILRRPSEQLPKAENKNKRKDKNNKR